jgi:hypothetical protein
MVVVESVQESPDLLVMALATQLTRSSWKAPMADGPARPFVPEPVRQRPHRWPGRRGVVTVAIVGMLVTRAVAQPCVGDCNGDGRVTVSELVTGVDMALGGAAGCPAMACGDPGLGVSLNCLVVAVHNALTGCAAGGADAVWMSYIPCRQCGDCSLPINELLGIINRGIPAALLPDGVTVLDSRIEVVQIACLACGCPEPGSPIYHVQVPRTDVDRLLAVGWSVEP